MSVMSQLSQQIQERLEQGESAEKIATALEVPLEWVVLQSYEDSVPLSILVPGTVLQKRSAQ
jgi:hypothetical protein